MVSTSERKEEDVSVWVNVRRCSGIGHVAQRTWRQMLSDGHDKVVRRTIEDKTTTGVDSRLDTQAGAERVATVEDAVKLCEPRRLKIADVRSSR